MSAAHSSAAMLVCGHAPLPDQTPVPRPKNLIASAEPSSPLVSDVRDAHNRAGSTPWILIPLNVTV